MNSNHIINLLSLLTPRDILYFKKIRIGAPNDGGYVVLDKLNPTQKIFSYGLSWNLAFDHDFAQRGHNVYMFDHTIENLTVQHPYFHWAKEGISTEVDVLGPMSTLEDHLSKFAAQEKNIILKMDIEGAEWKVLEKAPLETLLCAEQIILELHDFRKIKEEAWYASAYTALKKLTDNFLLFHVHANNCAPIVLVDNIAVADVLEVSFVRKDLVTSTQSQTFYPTHLDAPNNVDAPDFALLFYPFLPTSSNNASFMIENIFYRLNMQLEYRRLINEK